MTPREIMQLLRNGQIDKGRAIKALTEFYQSRGTALGLADELARTEVREVVSGLPAREPGAGEPGGLPPGTSLDWAGTMPLSPIQPSETVQAADMAAPASAAAGGYVDPRTAQEIAREEASLTYGGRQNIFGGFMGGQPGFGQYNPLVQRGINRAFGPLSAQFGLQAATDPYWFGEGNRAGVPSEPQTLDFRSFLQGTPQRWGQQEWINQLAPLGQAFSADVPNPEQITLRGLYGDEAIQNRLMGAVLGQGISPYLRRFVPGAVGDIRQRMFETDPSVDPFQQFLPSPGTWGRT
jgi:hypothetical protein